MQESLASSALHAPRKPSALSNGVHGIASNPAARQPTTIPDTNARGSANVVVPWGPGTSGKPPGS